MRERTRGEKKDFINQQYSNSIGKLIAEGLKFDEHGYPTQGSLSSIAKMALAIYLDRTADEIAEDEKLHITEADYIEYALDVLSDYMDKSGRLI